MLSVWHVTEGDVVETDQVLGELDAHDLELAVRAAQVALAQARAQRDALLANPRPEEIAPTESQVAVAQAALEAAKAERSRLSLVPSEADLAAAQAALFEAEQAYQAARQAHEDLINNQVLGAPEEQARYQVQAMKGRLDAAQARVNELASGPAYPDWRVAAANVDAATAQLSTAQNNLDLLLAGPSEEAITQAELKVEAAQITLAQAEAALAKAQLVAPFSGTVVALYADTGEMVSPGTPVLLMADLSEMCVETTDLDEWDVVRVKVGQNVIVSINAFENKVLQGKVASVSLQGTVIHTGDTVYTVVIVLDEQDPELHWGMTTKVIFEEHGR